VNNPRRKDIQSISDKLGDLEALLSEIKDAIESVKDEEQEYYDNMPEGLQGSDRGYAAEAAISNLEDAISMMEDLDVDSIRSSLDTAAE